MTPPKVPYVYYADIERIIDGDTLVLAIDLGFRNTRHERVRLARINAPEMSTPEGLVAQAFASKWIATAPAMPKRFVIASTRSTSPVQDNYGRFIVEVWRSSDGDNLNDRMLTSGHATKYGG